MKRTNGCVILTKSVRLTDGESLFRLIETADAFSDGWVYSLFVTTTENGTLQEEFLYDVSRSRRDAVDILRRLCTDGVKASSLHSAVSRLLSEPVILP